MMTLQLMLLQCDGRMASSFALRGRRRGSPTSNCTRHFETTVAEGHVEGGKVSNLKVTPASRAKDVVIVPVS